MKILLKEGIFLQYYIMRMCKHTAKLEEFYSELLPLVSSWVCLTPYGSIHRLSSAHLHPVAMTFPENGGRGFWKVSWPFPVFFQLRTLTVPPLLCPEGK